MNIVDLIKYEGDNTIFVWKHPSEDFNTMSQLIVHESQEAILFLNGQALDLFGPGRHTLETQNIPLLRKFINIPTGGQSPFHCEVYYINKTEQMSIKWGTDSQVQYMEPTYNFPLQLGASGEMSLKVDDSRKLLVKIVGTERTLSQSSLIDKFRSFLLSRIKPYLAQVMQKGEFNIFEVDAHMNELSVELHSQLVPDFLNYGISLERFFVTTLVKPENDTAYKKFKEIHLRKFFDVQDARIRQEVGVIDQQTSAQRMTIESAAIAQKRAQEGYTYQQERGYGVAEKVAQNEGIGNFSSAGIGLGMMGGVAGGMGAVVAGMTSDALNPMTSHEQNDIDSVNLSQVAGNGFGQEMPDSDSKHVSYNEISDFEQRIKKLEILKGRISDEQYDAKMKEILDSI